MTPSPSIDGLPSASAVAAQFQRALADGKAAASGPLLGLLLDLHRNNLDQWRREDLTRASHADDATVAAAKRDIDALNATRHGMVESIDAALAAAIDQVPSAIPATESPAMVFDRMSVLTIRIHFTELAARTPGADGDRFRARLPHLRDQLAVSVLALDGLFDDIRTGRKRFVPYQSLKLYGSPATTEDDPSP